MNFNSIDIFSGIGGLSEGMKEAGFKVNCAVEIDVDAVNTFKLNHRKTILINKDIRKTSVAEIKKTLNGHPLHLLAGCPPCQGFSSLRRLNNKRTVRDDRNELLFEYLRMVKGLKPLTIMMENVPGIENYFLFKKLIRELKKLEYQIDYRVVNVKDYGVPQRRRRMVVVGSKLGTINVAPETNERVTVRDVISKLNLDDDPRHNIKEHRTQRVREMISQIPPNGGSRKDLPKKYLLKCHQPENVGFNDIYGRLRWDDYSTTITGGCLNPSKGRFLHPTKNRAITPREAALLQSFRIDYKFGKSLSKDKLALYIGNALPPKFSYIQSKNISDHLKKHLG